MPRVYLSLLPLPALAVLVAISACNKPRSEEVSHVIPPPPVEALVEAKAPAQLAAAPTAPVAQDDAPSAEEVKAFARPVKK